MEQTPTREISIYLNVRFILSLESFSEEIQPRAIDKERKNTENSINFTAMLSFLSSSSSSSRPLLPLQTEMDFLLGNQRRASTKRTLEYFLNVYDNAIRDQIDKLTSGRSRNLQFRSVRRSLLSSDFSSHNVQFPFRQQVNVERGASIDDEELRGIKHLVFRALKVLRCVLITIIVHITS